MRKEDGQGSKANPDMALRESRRPEQQHNRALHGSVGAHRVHSTWAHSAWMHRSRPGALHHGIVATSVTARKAVVVAAERREACRKLMVPWNLCTRCFTEEADDAPPAE